MFWIVWYDKAKAKYQLRKDSVLNDGIVMFKVFDMAYEYVNRMNHPGLNIGQISRWTR